MDTLEIQKHIICNNLTFEIGDYIKGIFEKAKANNEITDYNFSLDGEKFKYYITAYTNNYIDTKSICSYVFEMYLNIDDIDTNKIECKIQFGNISNRFLLKLTDSDKVNKNRIIKEIDTIIQKLEISLNS